MSSLRTKPKIPIREKLVALLGALTLAYTAWGFGGVIAWSLHIMLAGGLLTLSLALIPLPADYRSPLSTFHFPLQSLKRLARTPAFYFALAFLVYLAIAAFNPAWYINFDERGWWLESIAPPLGTWLPTSVEAPYEPMNAWRIFNMHLAAFSLAIGLYLGLSSRRTTQCVLWSFLVSVSLMALVAIIQKYTQADAVLWAIKSENPNFWGSYFYRNQGVALLNWGIVNAGLLYFYHARRSREEVRSGGPHFLAFCFIGLIAVSVVLALSRGGILFAAVLFTNFLLLALADYFYHIFGQIARHTLWITSALTFTLTLLLAVGIFQANRAIDWQAVEDRFGDIGETIENADSDARMRTSILTWRMAQDQLWTGWGAGSFRYAFPMYQQEMNELFYMRNHRNRGWEGRKFYRYAHNDILQFLAEYGIVGCSLLILAILSLLAPALRAFRSSPFLVFFLLVGICCALGHAFLDFIFHSPSFWVAFIAGITLCSRLLLLEAKRG